MSSSPLSRRARRAAPAAAFVCGLALVVATGHPAAAHAGVTASEPRALAKNVTLTFTSEAESAKAGLTKVQVVLAQDMSSAAVILKQAPKGWKFSHSQGGYTISGAPLAVGRDAVHSVVVQQLPDAKELVFRVLETYGDGSQARWIEEPRAGVKPENPAPVVKLRAKAAGAVRERVRPPSAPATPPPTAETTPKPPEAGATASATPLTAQTKGHDSHGTTGGSARSGGDGDGGGNGAVIAAAAGGVAVLAAGGFWAYRRRSSGT
ncbi:DUF1775 domain-containing protein [Streptomyces sp. NPDC006798]|uniref:DUF1775 domain-containing protein n=1 Tax=Streptomyces sp. NPDC006798 TaxID=3155462 RepID=UPI0033E26803